MKRLRVALALIAIVLALGAMPAASAGEGEAPSPESGPVVIVGEEAEPPAEDAWTFRFLVPTLLVLSGVVVAGVLVGYAVRIKGRYRVIQ
ncbi:MAG TPA: hypothetical protein VK960_03925 [Acidimicrobiia bacterium]|nr:hypothetical protein [Acidimicrobiia bacterium]